MCHFISSAHVCSSFYPFQINLRLILVSGKTKEFIFSPNDSAADIAKHVYDNWPMGKPLLVTTGGVSARPTMFHTLAAAG